MIMTMMIILRYLTDDLSHLPAVGQLRSIIRANIMTLFCIESLFVLELLKEEKKRLF